MSSGILLETHADRTAEKLAISRLTNIMQNDAIIELHKMPDLSRVDYLVSRDNVLTWAIEVKTRKQPAAGIQRYGGLMLKQRKLLELQQVADTLQLSTWLLFAFGNGAGELYVAQPTALTDLEPHTPPRRHNYRGLACDNEPVVYLQWEKDLRQIA